MTEMIVQAYRRLARFISDRASLAIMLARTGRRRALALVLLSIARGMAPNLVILAIGSLVRSVPQTISHGFGSRAGHHTVVVLIVVGVVLLADALIQSLLSYLGATMGQEYVLATAESLARATSAPRGVSHLQDSEIHSEVSALNPRTDRTGLYWGLPNMLAELVTSRIAGVGAAIILIQFHWWAPLVLAVGWILLNVGFREWARRLQLGFAEGRRGALRWAGYLRGLAVDEPFSKEIRMFGLASWVVQRFSGAWQQTMAMLWTDRRMGSRAVWLGTAAVLLCHAAVLTVLGFEAGNHAIAASQLTVYAQAIMGTAALGVIGTPELQVVRAATNARQLLSLEHRLAERMASRSAGPLPPRQPDLSRAPRREVCLEGIHFRYDTQDSPVLNGLDLTIPVGQSLAIVGENGAGKSTLIRLLSGVEEPQRGRISVDGIDLNDVDPRIWRRQLGVVFQDFVHYQLSLTQNVGFGRLALSTDQVALKAALHRAGRSHLADLLPQGWDTILASSFGGGTDLSGGQWQQVAIARAFLAVEGGARVLILDEPTASLDPKTEMEMFEQLLDKTSGLTTILVTHRLASVRNVDRIVVLDQGRIVEDGNHEELIGRGGLYARMFHLQAERFNLDTSTL
jgi:ATP-binding cassette subfamily B protein